MTITMKHGIAEKLRLKSLRSLDVLDTDPEEYFDTIAQLAATVCRTPIALVSLVDENRQWFKAQVGLPDVNETPREVAFCAHAIRGEDLMEISDATRDGRFADNPLVTGSPQIRFYAGMPLKLSDGMNVGTLCVIDSQPRELTSEQREVLIDLAQMTATALDARRSAANDGVLKNPLPTAESRASLFVDQSPVGLFSVDLNGDCTYTNQTFQRIFDLTFAETLGTGWLRALTPDHRENVSTSLRHAIKSRTALRIELDVVQPDAATRKVRLHATAFVDTNGDLQGYTGTIEDTPEDLS